MNRLFHRNGGNWIGVNKSGSSLDGQSGVGVGQVVQADEELVTAVHQISRNKDAVIVAEPERKRIIELTVGNTLVGPGSIPWEIGNAFSAMFKRSRVTLEEAEKGLAIFESIQIRYLRLDFVNAMSIAYQTNLYAYDAYYLDCAMRHHAPLLTLDTKLMAAAKNMNVVTLEI